MKYNKSKTYLLPLINKHLKCFNIDFIENCYIYNDLVPKSYLCISYRIPEERVGDFKKYISEISSSPYYLGAYTKETYVVVLRFPEELDKDYLCFKRGLYSKISFESKSTIQDFLSANYFKDEIIKQVYGVLYKTKIRREYLEELLNIKLSKEDELGSKPLRGNELIKLEEYVKI